jgi:hypothetical protein
MTIFDFEEYLNTRTVKKQSPNLERAHSLQKEAEEKKKYLEVSIKSIPSKSMNANFIIDYCYDILMELIRAKMFTQGYNAGNSHEAEVSYLRKLKYSEADIRFMDELRYNRNGTKYYGTIFGEDYAKTVLTFMNKLYPKLNDSIK